MNVYLPTSLPRYSWTSPTEISETTNRCSFDQILTQQACLHSELFLIGSSHEQILDEANRIEQMTKLQCYQGDTRLRSVQNVERSDSNRCARRALLALEMNKYVESAAKPVDIRLLQRHPHTITCIGIPLPPNHDVAVIDTERGLGSNLGIS